MPLYADAEILIRANLHRIAQGERVRTIAIGVLTEIQHAAINNHKEAAGLPLLENPEIIFLGKHAYDSRVLRDGYTIEDVITQVQFALADSARVVESVKMTALKSTCLRADGYGNEVLDEAVFELTTRKPRAELYSIVPKGDKVKPKRQAK